jgi:hypothetical protein
MVTVRKEGDNMKNTIIGALAATGCVWALFTGDMGLPLILALGIGFCLIPSAMGIE